MDKLQKQYTSVPKTKSFPNIIGLKTSYCCLSRFLCQHFHIYQLNMAHLDNELCLVVSVAGKRAFTTSRASDAERARGAAAPFPFSKQDRGGQESALFNSINSF